MTVERCPVHRIRAWHRATRWPLALWRAWPAWLVCLASWATPGAAAASEGALLALEGHGDVVGGVAFSPDGRHLAGGGSGALALWELTTGEPRWRREFSLAGEGLLALSMTRVESLAFSPGGKELAVAGSNTVLEVLAVATGEAARPPIPVLDFKRAVAYSPDGRYLVSGGEGFNIEIREAASGHLRGRLEGHRGTVTGLAVSPDGRWLASVGEDHHLRLWALPTGRPLGALEGHLDQGLCVAFGPDGRRVVTGGTDRRALVWDVASLGGHVRPPGWPGGEEVAVSDSPVRVFQAPAPLCALRFAKDGKALVGVGQDRALRAWGLTSGEARQLFTAASHPGEPFEAAAFSRDDARLATLSHARLELWDASHGRKVYTFKGRDWFSSTFEFSPDGNLVATLEGRRLQLWHVTGSRRARVAAERGCEDRVLAFHPGGMRLATAGSGNDLRLWELTPRDGAWQLAGPRILAGHLDRVAALAFSPDGRCLASAGDDGTIRLWDGATGQPIRVMQGIGSRIAGLAFSPDGRSLASVADTTLALWDVASGARLRAYQGRHASLTDLAYDPGGRWVATSAHDGTVSLWDAARRPPGWPASLP
ncbi:MAG: hypothetical protein VKS61_14480 [Candidatus Sericytochromatia bacterium]|nr:hypothetical protein [Candidatus Sericytochromatia bacterium]